uniref:Laminin G domain-containing protein n=1 Tax=Malurus cyaneus samueli TaxID=2593467 RepID=A0A8C5T8X2_9PASS
MAEASTQTSLQLQFEQASHRDCFFLQLGRQIIVNGTTLRICTSMHLGCSDEFFAGEEEPISFFSSRSYISFPSWNVDNEGIFECTLQTLAARGLLLYHPGQAGDFIAMEMEDGLIKAYVGKHRSRTHLFSHRSVNDNRWHYVKLKFAAEYLQLTLDEETVKKTLPPPSKLPLLEGSFFVGGVDDSIRSEVIKLISVSGKYARGGSFKGCLRNLKANSEKKSLKNVLVTKDISAGCEMQSAFNTNLSLAVKSPPVKAAPVFAISHEKLKDCSQGNFFGLQSCQQLRNKSTPRCYSSYKT